MNLRVQDVKDLENKIGSLSNSKEPIVSEHAILRYLERIGGLDLEEIKNKILTTEIKNIISTLGGNGTYPNEGFKVIMKDNIVTTITVK